MKKQELTKAYFCVPADFNEKSLIIYSELNKKYSDRKVAEIYGSLPTTPYNSGRPSKSIPQISFKVLKQYVKKCNKLGIEFNYTFNASTLGNREFNTQEKKKIVSFIKKLYALGIRNFTITVPSVISLLSNNFKNIKIVLSITNRVKSPYQLNELLESGKISRAYLDEDMNRRVTELKELTDNSKVPLGLILNNFCLFECAYKSHHYNFLAFKDNKTNVEEYYALRCRCIKANNPEEVIKIPFIRPKDIPEYTARGIHWFKIAGREMVGMKADFPLAVEAYMSGKYDGNLIDLFNNFSNKVYNRIFSLSSKKLDPFFRFLFNKRTTCSRGQCNQCGMCKRYARFVKINKAEKRKLTKFKLLK